MPLPALLLLIATLLPLAAFGVLALLGRRMGDPLAGYVGTFFIAGSFFCSGWAMISWLSVGTGPDVAWGFLRGPIHIPVRWLPIGRWPTQEAGSSGYLNVGLYVDSLTVVMFAVVTLVATLVHFFSIGYMRGDARFARFFTYLGLFCFSMLGLLVSGTLLQLLIFWELVGLCSYLLIGFWYERKSATNAAIKAFVVNRIGDVGFLIGIGILVAYLGNATLPDVWRLLGHAGAGGDVLIASAPGPAPSIMTASTTIPAAVLTLIGVGLFCGAVGKSAQFPLHVWLPDAMEGPTPVSALIHAATMVAAGVYLVARIFPILTPEAKLVIATVGCITLTMAALCAMAQRDIKRVLAWSTVSQLGYMMLAIGIGSWVGGLFHLVTHAFFKALLFLGAGSVIRAAHHEQDLSQFGGLLRKLPVTAITFFIAVLAISGTPFLSGYYSKETILAHAGAFFSQMDAADHARSWKYGLLFALPTIVAYLTPFYMMRCWMLTFWGTPRNPTLYKAAREQPSLWLPLIGLAVLSIVAGYGWFPVKSMIDASIAETNQFERKIDASFNGFATAWPSEAPHELGPLEPAEVPVSGTPAIPPAQLSPGDRALQRGHELVGKWAWYAFAVGLPLAAILYLRGDRTVGLILSRVPPLRGVQGLLLNGFYLDRIYVASLAGATVGLSSLCALFDRRVIDGAVNGIGKSVRVVSILSAGFDRYVVDGAVNGVATASRRIGIAVRAPQAGRIRIYVAALLAAVAIGLSAIVAVSMARW